MSFGEALVSGKDIACCVADGGEDWTDSEIDRLGSMKSEVFALLSWDTPDLDLGEYDELGRENLDFDEGETVVEDVVRAAEVAYFWECAPQCTQILL